MWKGSWGVNTFAFFWVLLMCEMCHKSKNQIYVLTTFSAQQQVDFLLLRRQAFLRAALRSKQMKVSYRLFLFSPPVWCFSAVCGHFVACS